MPFNRAYLKNRPSIRKWLLLLCSGIALLSCRVPFVEKENTLTFEGLERTYAVQTVVVNLTQTLTTPTTVSPTSTQTPKLIVLPTQTMRSFADQVSTKGSTPTSTPPPCDQAGFVLDVTVPDGARYYPGDHFIKTWRVKNIGSCIWTSAYKVVFVSGDRLSSPASVSLPGEVKPQQSVDISVELVAPNEYGHYRGNWKLQNEDSKTFGLPDSSPFYFDILVVEPEAGAVIYNFSENYCEADWTSTARGLEPLPCPGERNDERGFVFRWDTPRLEDGSYKDAAGLETHPTWETHLFWNLAEQGGWIKGEFPAVLIESGSRFKTTLSCLYGAESCDVNFVLQYRITGNPWEELGAWNQTADGVVEVVNIDLANLVGLQVEFILWVDANSNGGLDQAVWVNPRIEN